MKRTATVLAVGFALVAGTASSPVAQAAEDGPFLVRLRAVNLDSANKDSTPLDLTVNDKVFPELDLSYFFTPNIALELVLTYPQEHTIRSGGAEIGTLKHLPPTLLAQYHFTNFGKFKPYLGIGLNYTIFSDVDFSPAVNAALHPKTDGHSIGWAAQVGFDYAITSSIYLNVDVKKVKIGTDITANGVKVGEFKVDPWLFGVGVGYRF